MCKRLIDLFGAIVGGILLFPVLVIIGLMIKSSGGPIFYSQERVGLGGRSFRMWKFRTMYVGAEDYTEFVLPSLQQEWELKRKLDDDPRVTRVGEFLRWSNLDELPQLWNVIKGDMSLVGPRPLPEYHLSDFEGWFCWYRHTVKPGITGLWQIHKHKNGTLQSFIKWDSVYISSGNLWLDFKIILATLKVW